MLKLIKYLFIFCISLNIFAIHNGKINEIREINLASAEAIKKQLITNTNRARVILPCAGIGALGIIGYLFYRSFKTPVMPVSEAQKLFEEARHKVKLDAYSKKKEELDTEFKKSKADKSTKSGESAKKADQSWKGWAYSGLINFGNNTKNFVMGVPSYLIQTIIWSYLMNKSHKIIRSVESYLPSIIDPVINHLNLVPHSQWFISNRTRFSSSLENLKRYIDLYANKIIVDQKIAELKGKQDIFISASALGENGSEELVKSQLAEVKREIDILIASRDIPSIMSEYDLCQIISLKTSLFIEQIEKIIGFLGFNDIRIKNSNVSPQRKLDVCEQNLAISKSLISYTNTLRSIISKEIGVGITSDTLPFLIKFEKLTSDIQKELHNIVDVEDITNLESNNQADPKLAAFLKQAIEAQAKETTKHEAS